MDRRMSWLSAIGLMSGTSYDGVDVALINTNGEEIGRVGPTGYRPYTEEERQLLRRAMAQAVNLADRTERPGSLADAEALVTQSHAEAVEALLAANGMMSGDIAVVGFHGQTVLHDPGRRLTVQLGQGDALASRLGIPVVHDFRAADVAAGGQGAPFMPVFHRAMVRMLDERRPTGVLNIGGVANLTYVDGDELIACDTGPGNALIDDFLRLRTGSPHDTDGRAAAAGRVDETAVARVLAHPFFAKPPPKSLDRNAFHHWVAEDEKLAGKSVEDGAATLTAVTAAAIARATRLLPRMPASFIAAGGGIRNPVLMRMLAERLAPSTITTADAVGWSGDALEAQGFAYLAVRSLNGLPISFPATTGVPQPMTGGVLARPSISR
jgi:anhydro-N-acetylmuramic acid kinase